MENTKELLVRDHGLYGYCYIVCVISILGYLPLLDAGYFTVGSALIVAGIVSAVLMWILHATWRVCTQCGSRVSKTSRNLTTEDKGVIKAKGYRCRHCDYFAYKQGS